MAVPYLSSFSIHAIIGFLCRGKFYDSWSRRSGHVERRNKHAYAHVFLCTSWAQLFTCLSGQYCFPTAVAKDETRYIRLSYCCWVMFRKEAGRFVAKLCIPKLCFFAGVTEKRGSSLSGLDTFLHDLKQIHRWLVGLRVSQIWCSRHCLEICFFFYGGALKLE
jgi:hypothetical protein